MPAPKLEQESTGRYQIRIFCGGERHRIRLGALDRVAATKRAALVARLSRVLAKREDLTPAQRLAALVAAASDVPEREVLDAIDQSRAKLARADKREPTFASVAKQWTDGAIAKRFPGLRGVECKSPKYGPRLAKLNETIGSVAIRSFRLEDAERALAALPPKHKAVTRGQYLSLIRRVLGLAVYPLRLRADNPIPDGFALATEPGKARPYLYPSEDRALLACTAIPLARRCLWGLLAREGMRLSEALALTPECIDFDRGAVRLDKNKTRVPRSWALSPGVASALAKVWPSLVDDVTPNKAAELLRADLRAAGVKRAELFLDTPERAPIRAHDLRGSFVTISLSVGFPETWVSDRTGHTNTKMISRYRRMARHAEELHLGTWDPLDRALGLAKVPGGLPGSGGSSRNPKRKRQPRDSGAEPQGGIAHVPACEKHGENASCAFPHEQVGRAIDDQGGLARAAIAAIDAGQWDVARALLGLAPK